jgi:hypothetical protein
MTSFFFKATFCKDYLCLYNYLYLEFVDCFIPIVELFPDFYKK